MNAADPGGEPPTRPPSQRNPILSIASGVMSFLLIAAVAGMIAMAWATSRLHAPGPLAADKVVVIPARTDVLDVVTELERQGVINSGLLFNAALLVEGGRSKIQAGEYLFKQKETMQGVMDMIVSGRQLLHSVTIPEGLTSQQAVGRLMADNELAGDVDKAPAEGSLHPETYKFFHGASRAKIIREMQRAQDKILKEVWDRRAADNPLKSPFELLTLASIVEKETGHADERPHVASVFLNRLQRGMRLQSDPTIVYGLVGGKGTLGSGITHAQLLQPTPYNTYLIDGLPPGPISNPGRASLEAVANPMHTSDLYFVADGSGGHVFSATLAQHNKNVQRWREIEKTKAAAEPNVDRVPPQDLPAPGSESPLGSGSISGRGSLRANQRSDLGAPANVFGSLPTFGGAPMKAAQSEDAFAKLGLVAPSLNYDASAETPASQISTASARQPFAGFGAASDSLGLALADSPSASKVDLDGPADSLDPAQNDATFMKDAQAAGRRGSVPSLPPINGHPRIIDASVGTPLDPLKDTTWDLNSPKVVPALN